MDTHRILEAIAKFLRELSYESAEETAPTSKTVQTTIEDWAVRGFDKHATALQALADKGRSDAKNRVGGLFAEGLEQLASWPIRS